MSCCSVPALLLTHAVSQAGSQLLPMVGIYPAVHLAFRKDLPKLSCVCFLVAVAVFVPFAVLWLGNSGTTRVVEVLIMG